MPLVSSLHGRVRMRRAARVRLALFVLLLVPIGLRALEAEVAEEVYLASRHAIIGASAHPFFVVERMIAAAGYLVAGILIDRFGLKRAFSLVFLAWSAVVTLGVVVADPLTYRVLSPLATLLLPGFVLTTLLVAVRLAWPARRRAIVVAALLLAYQYGTRWDLARHLFWRPDPAVPESWQYPIFAFATAGAVLFALWVFLVPEVDRESGLDLRPVEAPSPSWARLIADPAAWSVVAIQFCVMLVWSDSPQLRWDFEAIGTPGALASSVMTPAAFLVAAWGSDHLYRAHRSWLAARRPLIVGGFAVAAIAALVGTLASQSGPALYLLDCAAVGTMLVAGLLVIDLAPRRHAGRFIGLVLTGEIVTSEYVRPYVETLATSSGRGSLVVVLVALAGGGLTALLLPRLHSAAD